MRFQLFVRQFVGPAIFLSAYFGLTVVGNIAYFLPGGDSLGKISIPDFHIGSFQYAETFPYLALLFLPFVVTPTIVVLVRPIASSTVSRAAARLLDFSRFEYSAISVSLYAYVICAFARADALTLLLRGSDAISAVEARFAVVKAVGFGPLTALKSLLVFLASYAFVRAVRSREIFWIATALVNFLLMTCLLILLNMKWPLLIYYAAISLTILMFFRRVLLGEIASILLILATYALVSAAVLRIPVAASSATLSTPTGPSETTQNGSLGLPLPGTAPSKGSANSDVFAAPQKAPPSIDPKSQVNHPERVKQASTPFIKSDDLSSVTSIAINPKELASKTVTAASQHAGYLSLTLFNRMAQPFPYYFEIFTKEGPICGTLIDRIQRKANPCQPSLVVYEHMFHDEFAGRGTAPQAIHVYGYALNGWLGAIIEILLASVVLGILTCVPINNDVTATIAVMGGLTGYYFSQLPFEGAIVYDHGMLWWMLLLVGYSTLKKLLSPKSRFENAEASCVVR